MNSVIDTHCHLDIMASMGRDRADALRAAAERGVEAVVQIATGLTSSEWNRDHAVSEPNMPRVYWTCGLHPESAADSADVPAILAMAKRHRDDAGFVGLGETGLDYYHDVSLKHLQLENFEEHLNAAADLALPLVVHLRDGRQYVHGERQTVDDALALVRKRPRISGVLHCFTYGYDEAMPFVDMGWFVSFSGIVTYKSAKIIQDAAVRLPLQAILVETDAPFLAPVPHRGKTN
ncbi:MAG: TatD family hydrolase, partial [Spirochaetia bacterium]|nr:TatD family hydrolase [Spirochaetia bacterium]